ncbi:hypothetical protein IWW38_006020 [Coemansia aciculifera]|uniref:Uncharacterized protein n=1 Tax=Coemansia aciculifera TaxID=417176 RepID=A0ACC1LUY9_9FUNG|nr:hypothetical protein IWW38_006020 [Coemansia aciculifera]
MAASHKQAKQDTIAPAKVTHSELDFDMGDAGFRPMHSQYNANKHSKSGLSGQLAQTQQIAGYQYYSQAPQLSTVAYQSQPYQPQQQHHSGHPGPVYQQPLQQSSVVYQAQNPYPMHQYQQQYGPQPIPSSSQAPATLSGYGGYAVPVVHSYSAQPSGPMYTQASAAQYGGQATMQHQQYHQPVLSQSVPVTYNSFNQPLGLAASNQNATYSSPQLVYPSGDNVTSLRPKKHVHFAKDS